MARSKSDILQCNAEIKINFHFITFSIITVCSALASVLSQQDLLRHFDV